MIKGCPGCGSEVLNSEDVCLYCGRKNEKLVCQTPPPLPINMASLGVEIESAVYRDRKRQEREIEDEKNEAIRKKNELIRKKKKAGERAVLGCALSLLLVIFLCCSGMFSSTPNAFNNFKSSDVKTNNKPLSKFSQNTTETYTNESLKDVVDFYNSKFDAMDSGIKVEIGASYINEDSTYCSGLIFYTQKNHIGKDTPFITKYWLRKHIIVFAIGAQNDFPGMEQDIIVSFHTSEEKEYITLCSYGILKGKEAFSPSPRYDFFPESDIYWGEYFDNALDVKSHQESGFFKEKDLSGYDCFLLHREYFKNG